MHFVWSVRFPDDACVLFESNSKYKASAVILSNRRFISEMPQLNDRNVVVRAIQKHKNNMLLLPDLDDFDMLYCASKSYYENKTTLLQQAPLHVQIRAMERDSECVLKLSHGSATAALAMFAVSH